MSGCEGLHCDGCGGKGKGALIALVAGAALCYGVYRVVTSKPVEHAAAVGLRVLEITAASVAGAVALAALIAAGVGIRRVVRAVLARRALSPRSRAGEIGRLRVPEPEPAGRREPQRAAEPHLRPVGTLDQLRAARRWN